MLIVAVAPLSFRAAHAPCGKFGHDAHIQLNSESPLTAISAITFIKSVGR